MISVTKEGVKFSTRGDIGTANIVCRQNTSMDKVNFSGFILFYLYFLGGLPMKMSELVVILRNWLLFTCSRHG